MVSIEPSQAARVSAADERLRLVTASLRVGNPANRAADLPEQADPLGECQIELDVDDIRTYERNPRRADNAKFDDIKESIRASGVRNVLAVTRRPGEAHFIVEAGGNTRLFAIQQLWRETGEARFQRLTVLFRPWRSESHVLIAHLIENEQRADMTFWDKASGMTALKSLLEAEQGQVFSMREFEAELKTFGIAVSTSTLSYYAFATRRLSVLGEASQALTGLDVKKLQGRFNLARRHAQEHAAIPEDAFYGQILEPVFRRHADEYRTARAFSSSALCHDCEEVLAHHLNEPVSELRAALDAPPPASVLNTGDKDGAAAVLDATSEDRGGVAAYPPHTPAVAEGSDTAASAAQPVSGDDAATAHRELPAAHQVLRERLRLCTELAAILEYLRPDDTAPCGMVLDAVPSGVTLLPSQIRAWWLLNLICGRAEAATGVAAPNADAPPEGLLLDRALLSWLFDTADAVACALWEVLVLARELRVLSSDCGSRTDERCTRQGET